MFDGTSASGVHVRWVLTYFLAFALSGTALAGGPFKPQPLGRSVVELGQLPDSVTARRPNRALTAGLAVALGAFGGHRLYLGTGPKVPLIYAVTFGGFYVLVAIDLAHVLFTKDLSPYQDNDRVFMWARPRAEDPIRP